MEEDQWCRTVTEREDGGSNRAAADDDGFVFFLKEFERKLCVEVVVVSFQDYLYMRVLIFEDFGELNFFVAFIIL